MPFQTGRPIDVQGKLARAGGSSRFAPQARSGIDPKRGIEQRQRERAKGRPRPALRPILTVQLGQARPPPARYRRRTCFKLTRRAKMDRTRARALKTDVVALGPGWGGERR